MLDWTLYPNFSFNELKCKHTNQCDMSPELMHILQSMRNQLNKPIIITSGFRAVEHPVERSKSKPGEHTHGMAVDILCSGEYALSILRMCMDYNIKRIGVNQNGINSTRFIHIGIADRYNLGFPPAIWTY